MPSFTLLGAAIIKRHYTQPYALGHEIVHSWIGNGVYNRHDGANWVEGLTTYLTNYYYHELIGDEGQAKEQRRLMLFGYAVYVKRDQDYPVARFTRKTDEKDALPRTFTIFKNIFSDLTNQRRPHTREGRSLK